MSPGQKGKRVDAYLEVRKNETSVCGLNTAQDSMCTQDMKKGKSDITVDHLIRNLICNRMQ